MSNEMRSYYEKKLNARDTAVYFSVSLIISALLKKLSRREYINVLSYALCMTLSAICAEFITAWTDVSKVG